MSEDFPKSTNRLRESALIVFIACLGSLQPDSLNIFTITLKLIKIL